MARLSFKSSLVEAPTNGETLTPGPVRAIRDSDEEALLLKKRKVVPVFKSDKVEVLRLRHEDAAKYYGSGTHWGHDVRTEEGYFDKYIKGHDPHLIHTIKGRKYLVYPKEHKIYNEAFRSINPHDLVAKHPELQDAFNELAEKHGWIAMRKGESSDEEWEKHVTTSSPEELPHVNDMSTKALAAFMERMSRVGEATFLKFMEQLTYARALDVTAHSIEGNHTLLNYFLKLYHGAKHHHPIKDLYERVKDDKGGIAHLAASVYGDSSHQPFLYNVVLEPELEVRLLNALTSSAIENVLKQYELGRVRFSDHGWEVVSERAPKEVLELHQRNKTAVPQKFLQRAQWHKFKKAR